MRFRAEVGLTPWIAGICGVAGFYAIVLGWRGAADAGSVSLQLPFVMSGAFGGLALVLLGAALLHIDTWRRLGAEENDLLRDVIDSAVRAAVALHDDERTEDG